MYEIKNPNRGGFMSQKYAAFNVSQTPINKMAFVGVEQYCICDADTELITNGLNACSGLSISAAGKVFLAHIPANHQSYVTDMQKAISREFNLTNFNNADVRVKIDLGSFSQKSNSLNTVLELLFELKLLDRVINQLQDYIKNNRKLLSTLAQIPDLNLQEFLAINSIKRKSGIHDIAEFIEKVKEYFVDAKGCVLSKGKQTPYEEMMSGDKTRNDFVSSNNVIPLPDVLQDLNQQERSSFRIHNLFSAIDYRQMNKAIPIPKITKEAEEIINSLTLIISAYLKHQLPDQQSKLFGGEPDHGPDAKKLYAELNQIRNMQITDTQKIQAITERLSPFINAEARGGKILGKALQEINQKLTNSVSPSNKHAQ